MATAELPANDRLSWAEICARYPREWVCVVDIERAPRTNAIESARVLGHGATCEEMRDDAEAWRKLHPVLGLFFTGPFAIPVPLPRIARVDEI